jgi:(1->4)-alpha-D-glucan 1-alpha-D-glucosylmutase
LNAVPGTRGAAWTQTDIILPASLAETRYRDIFTDRVFDFRDRAAINWAFADHPFAVLLKE